MSDIQETLIIRPEELRADTDTDGRKREKQGQLDLLRRELKKIALKIDTLVDLVGDQSIDRQTFTERFLPLKERKEKIQEELPRIQAELDYLETSSISKDYLIEQATTFASMWPVLNYDEKIKLVDELVEEIKIQDDSLHFTLTYTPPFRKLGKGAHNLKGSVFLAVRAGNSVRSP